MKERETGTAPADRPQGFPARGKKALKQEDSETGTAPPAGGEAPRDGGKRSVKERETETTPASQKTPVMDVSRQARAVWVSSDARNGKARVAWVSTSPQNSTTRAARVSTNTQNSETGVAWVSTNPQNSKTGAAQVSTSPQNSKTGAVWVSTDAVGAAKRTGGDRRNGRTRPRGRHVPRHHPVDPSPGMPIALETHWPMAPSVDEVSHSRGMHTPLTPHGAARSCSRRVEVLRLERLLDTPAGSLRLTHRKTGGVFAPAGSDPYTW